MAKTFARKNRPAPAAVPVTGVTGQDPEVTVLEAIALPRGPVGDIAVDSAAGTIVTGNAGRGSISVIDSETLAVRGVVPVGGEPVLVAVAEDRAFVAISSLTSDALVVVNTQIGEIIGSYPLAFSATALAVSPDGKRVYVGRTGEDHVDVAVIDTTAERIGSIELGFRPGTSVDAVRVDPSGRHLYVATTGLAGSALLTVDTGTARVQRRLRLPSPIRDLALGRDGLAYVLRSDRRHGGAIDIVDLGANAVIDALAIGGAPTQLAISPHGGRLYVVDYDRVAVIDVLTTDIVDELTGPAAPSCVAVRADGRRVYVADFAGEMTALAVPSSTLPLAYPQFGAAGPRLRTDMRQLSPAV
jgi:YVTN family beta-propeller protein